MKNDHLTELFTGVGDTIRRRWEQSACEWEAFPGLAEEALQDGSPLLEVAVDDLYRWVLTNPKLPKQQDPKAKFAQPPVTVYSDDKFHIAFLFWTTSTTAIHQHAFEGAFRVFLGSSIQSTYGFTEEQRWGDDLRRGRLEMESIKLLRTGEICAIHFGASYIHSIYHLDNPSITLIIRTNGRPDHPEPQYSYEYPGFAVNPFRKTQELERTKQILSHLHRIGHPQWVPSVREALATNDAFGVYEILDHVRGMDLEAELPSIFHELGARFGDGFSEPLPELFRDKDRMGRLVNARRTVTDPEGRFFLALLLNVADAGQFRTLLTEQFPGVDPQEVISRWVMKLLETKSLGIEASSFSGLLVRGMLAGNSLEQVVRKLSPILRTEAAIGAVKAHGAELVYLFRPIFDAVAATQTQRPEAGLGLGADTRTLPAAPALAHAAVG